MARIKRNLDSYDYYNKHLKIEFINWYEANKTGHIRKIFEKTFAYEKLLLKDLSEFNIDEIEAMMSTLNVVGVAQSRIPINEYIRYVKLKNNEPAISPLDEDLIKERCGSYTEWESQFKPVPKYITLERLHEIEDSDINRQDAVVFRLFFEGLRLEEMEKLSLDDIDGCIITLPDRQIKVSDRCIKLIMDAYKEEKHISLDKNRLPLDYASSDKYILKRVHYTFYNNSTAFIIDRITKIRKYLKLENITSTTIARSGMIYKAKDIFLSGHENEYLPCSELNTIANYFGYTSWSWLRCILTRTTILSLYGDAQEKKTISDKETGDSNQFPFWRIQEYYGEQGEIFVKQKLKSKKYKVSHQPAIAGYDFLAIKGDETLRIEVKTVTSFNGNIYLSINELITAFETDGYLLYIVVLKDADKLIADCYEIENPTYFFGFKEDKIREQFGNNECAGMHSIYVKLNKDIFSSFKKVF